MKRQRGRNRGGGGGQGGGGGGKPQHNVNRAFDSNGPDNIKIRGHAQHVYEKYQQLARDASSAGDRVLAENYLQHAEHYFRTLRAIQPNRAASEIVNRDTFTSGYDIDFEDTAAETAMEEADAQAAERAANPQTAPQAQGEGDDAQVQNLGGQNANGQNNNGQNGGGQQGQRRDREDRYRPEGEFRRDREDRFRDRPERVVNNDPRQQGQNGQQGQNVQSGGERQNGEFQGRGDRPRYRDREDRYRDREPRTDAQRQDAPRAAEGEFRRDRYDRQDRQDRPTETPRADPMPVVEPQGGGFAPSDERAGVLRSQDGGVSAAPAFLQAATPAPAAADAEAPVRKPRARRKPAAAAEEV